MTPGPRPLPTAMKRLRGTFRKDRQTTGEPLALPLPRSVKPPGWLSAEAVAAWRRLVRLLTGMRVLGAQDLELLAVLADQIATYERAGQALAAKPALSFVVLDGDGNPKGLTTWPEIKIKAQAAAEIRRLAEHFGLSPSSRSRVSAHSVVVEHDPFAEFDPQPNPLDRFLKRRA